MAQTVKPGGAFIDFPENVAAMDTDARPIKVQTPASPVAPSHKIEQAAAASLNRSMEAVVRRLPAQYLWGYHRYKQPRQAGSARMRLTCRDRAGCGPA